MLRLNVTRVGFLMGVSLLLAAIIYFFAANWGGLGRADKILASAGIMVLFYGVSFIFSKMKIMLGQLRAVSRLVDTGTIACFYNPLQSVLLAGVRAGSSHLVAVFFPDLPACRSY
jgi:uncharacterized membrane protein